MVTNFNLDLSAYNKYIPKIIHMMQFETGRQLTMKIDADAISSAELWILRPNDTHYMAECLVNGHTIVCDIPDEFLAVTGNAMCQLKLFKSDEWVNTFSFILAVEKSAEGEITEAETTILTEWFANEGQALLDAWTEESKAAIEQKGQETIDSIPDDYTALSAQVDKNTSDIVKNKANADDKFAVINNILSGDVIDFKTVEETSYEEAIGNGCKGADVQMIGGKSVVFNQLISYEGKSSSSSGGLTFTNNNDGSWTVSGVLTDGATLGTKTIVPSTENKYFIPNNRYYLRGIKNGSTDTVRIRVAYNADTTTSMVYATDDMIIDYTLAEEHIMQIYIYGYFKTEQTFTVTPTFVNLTQEFGSAIADTLTLEDCRKIFGGGYLPYNTGEIKSANVDEVEIVGANIWNEQWEIGALSTVGANMADNGCIRSIGYIKCEQNTEYVTSSTHSANLAIRFYSYEASAGSLGSATNVSVSQNGSFVTPTGANFFRFYQRIEPTEYSGGISFVKKASIKHFPFPIELNGINDSVYDYVDFETKTLHRRCGVVPLYGLSWGTVDTSVFNLSKDAIRDASGKNIMRNTTAPMLCTKYPYSASGADKTMYQVTNSIRIVDSAYTDIDLFKAMLEEQQVNLVYQLATEEIYDVTDIVSDIYSVVESGGSIIYHNEDDTLHLPTPHRVEYVRKLSEVLA